MNTTEQIVAADWLPTKRLASMALGWYAHSSNTHGWQFVWQAVSSDLEAAEVFYAGIEDDEELRELAASALADAGWSVPTIAYRLS